MRRTGMLLLTIGVLAGIAAPATGQARHDVDVSDDSFAPAQVTVQVGDTVAWSQSGSNPHSVTASDGSFDSHPVCPPDCMGPGDTHEQRFDTPGEVAYYCKIHGTTEGQGMAGVITVTAQPEPEPEPATDPEPAADAPEDPEPAPADTLAETGSSAALVLLAGLLLTAGVVTLRRRGRPAAPPPEP